MFCINWYTDTGPLKRLRETRHDSLEAAKNAVREAYPSAKFHHDNEYTVRCTITSAGGRPGRNVAWIEPDVE